MSLLEWARKPKLSILSISFTSNEYEPFACIFPCVSFIIQSKLPFSKSMFVAIEHVRALDMLYPLI
mgnify:CR=1 FL=1